MWVGFGVGIRWELAFVIETWLELCTDSVAGRHGPLGQRCGKLAELTFPVLHLSCGQLKLLGAILNVASVGNPNGEKALYFVYITGLFVCVVDCTSHAN